MSHIILYHVMICNFVWCRHVSPFFFFFYFLFLEITKKKIIPLAESSVENRGMPPSLLPLYWQPLQKVPSVYSLEDESFCLLNPTKFFYKYTFLWKQTKKKKRAGEAEHMECACFVKRRTGLISQSFGDTDRHLSRQMQ